MSAVGSQPFSIGSVIGQSLAVLGRNLVSFLLIALIVTIAMYIVIGVTAVIFFGAAMMSGASMMPSGGESMGPLAMLSLGGTAVVGIIVIVVLAVAISQLSTAAITFGTIQDLRGRRAGIGECLSRGIALMLPVLGVSVLGSLLIFGIAGVVGYVLYQVHPVLGAVAAAVLTVAGAIMLWVAIPVAVVEGPGVIASLQRSVALTAGYRWHLLGMFILLGIAAVVVFGGYGLLVEGLTHVSGALGATLSFIGNIVLSLLVNAYLAALAAVGYYSLRVGKEGADIAEVAKVFD